ncbi:MAG: hypothetical protein J0M24_27115 [Verrucomicrobia bacterium]|nr:hypothetical protein [Verrucomicrobiota bacterium]
MLILLGGTILDPPQGGIECSRHKKGLGNFKSYRGGQYHRNRINASLTTDLQLNCSAVVIASYNMRRGPIGGKGHHNETCRPSTNAECADIIDLNPKAISPTSVEPEQRLAQPSWRDFGKELTLAQRAVPYLQLDLSL